MLPATLITLVLLPIASVLWFAAFPTENIWPHMMDTVLPRYVSNTLVLMIGVGVASACLGTVLAYIVTHFEFTGRKAIEFALFLPLAMPSYIAAFALVDFLEYAGPVQVLLRDMMGFDTAQDYVFPQIRSRMGAVFVMTLTLYPYVYLLARISFKSQSADTAHIAATLGLGPIKRFVRLSLPMARPGIIAGMAVVMMETVNDFGTVDYFAIQTLTTGIFSIWLESYNIGGAAQIALVLLSLIVLLATLERISRKRANYNRNSRHTRPMTRAAVQGWTNIALLVCTALPIVLGFLLPVAILLSHMNLQLPSGAGRALMNSLHLGILTAGLTVLVCAVFVPVVKTFKRRTSRIILVLATLGYAIPGAVLALGVLVPLAGFDNWLADTWLDLTGVEIGLLLTGGITALIAVYFVRFFAIGVGAIDTGIAGISPQLHLVASTLGQGPVSNFKRVTWPLLQGSIATAAVLIFVDTVKELPATILLRPFNYETLATHTFMQAKLENLAGASVSALMIVGIASVAVILFAKASK